MKYLFIITYLAFYTTASLCQGQDSVCLLMPAKAVVEELQTNTALHWEDFLINNSNYQILREDWLKNYFLPKIKAGLPKYCLKKSRESFDCDNFSEIIRNEIVIENHLIGNSGFGGLACAVVNVKQNFAFSRINGNKRLHSLVLIRTENGWNVLEPQTLKMAKLNNYPNRLAIESVYF